MLVCRETDSLGCVNCVEKGWNKMENKVTVVLADANEEFRTMLRQRMEGTGEFHVAARKMGTRPGTWCGGCGRSCW